MTREVEYRAYWKSKGEIRDVVDIYFGKKNFVQMIRVLCEHDGMSYPSDDICVDDFIIMQYTGIKDKNGVKIYEGDVVVAQTVERSPFSPDYVSGFLKGIIVYHGNSFCILSDETYYSSWTNAAEFEVIGNIYEEKK